MISIIDKKSAIAIVFLCRNEEKAIGKCIEHAKNIIQKNKIKANIYISDSSTDNSPRIAERLGATVIKHDKVGYGNAILEGVKGVSEEYVTFCDGDATYDLETLPKMIEYLDSGYDVVLGNRFDGHMENDSMPPLHKYIGNPILSFIFRIFFGSRIRDAHCGLRAVRKSSFERLPLNTTGMEFASEMLIKSIRAGLKIKEIPINYHRRIGKSKLRSFHDGWKHLRFMLLYSPKYLFLYPGLLLSFIGLSTLLWFYFGTPVIFGRRFLLHPMFLSSLIAIAGIQITFFAVFAKAYSINHLYEKPGIYNSLFRVFTLENAILLGSSIICIGFAFYALILYDWVKSGFGNLDEIKSAILGLTIIIIGIQIIFSSFMLSILSIREK